MPNPLTGDFDAVAQVSVATVNRLLASMHQNHGNDSGLPTLPHRAKLRVGDKPLPAAAAGIRGTVQVQIGTPTISLAGAPRDADISCWIRARYDADAGTTALPEFIHGRVAARFRVEPETVAGNSSLRAIASPDDAHIIFADSGLSSGDLAKINTLIRHVLRTRIDAVLPLPAGLPPAATDFRAITDSQNRMALALPVTVSGDAPQSGVLGDVFLDSSAFAVAASGELIIKLLQPAIEALNHAKPGFTISRKVGFWKFSKTLKAHYTISMSASVVWKNGTLTLKIAGTAETPTWWAPNADFTISQTIAFSFDNTAQMIVISPAGQPDVSVDVHGPFGPLVEGKAEGAAKDRFIEERDKALATAQASIQTMLVQQVDRLRKLLRRIDDGADLALTSGQFTDDGVLVRGLVTLSPRKAPRVEFTELGDGSGYSAFTSWVPGGRIKEYKWTWWRNGDPIDELTGGPVVHKAFLSDRFVLQQEKLPILTGSPTPPGSPGGPSTGSVGSTETVIAADMGVIFDPTTNVAAPVWGQVCLRIFGEQADSKTGQMSSVWENAIFDPALTCTFDFLGEIELLGYPRQLIPTGDPFPKGVNVFVYSPGGDDVSVALQNLHEAVRRSERSEAGLLVVLAVQLDRNTDTVRLLSAGARTHLRGLPRVGALIVDRNSAWLRLLDLPAEQQRPASRLVDAMGRLVWRHDGTAETSALTAALQQHLRATRPMRRSLLRPTPGPGDLAPEFTFELAPGRRTALHHFRGRRVALLFAPAGTNPLDALPNPPSPEQQIPAEEKPLVIAVQDGSISAVEAGTRALPFDYIAVADPDSRISRMYGIQIRPTLALVDRDGRVSSVRVTSNLGRETSNGRPVRIAGS